VWYFALGSEGPPMLKQPRTTVGRVSAIEEFWESVRGVNITKATGG
jgi:hypothetical protein